MPIFLVQHGRCLPKEADPEKGLSDEGKREVERIAEVAAHYGVQVDRIVHSGKKRARQTAQRFASALKPRRGSQEMAGLRPLDAVKPVADALSGNERLMLVGHLPFMSRLASYLVTGSAETPVFEFQNGGIVCLNHQAASKTWIIQWTLMPTIA
jgi:phosphohistidine phosphatase